MEILLIEINGSNIFFIKSEKIFKLLEVDIKNPLLAHGIKKLNS